MNYYVDIHADLLPDMQTADGKILSEADAQLRLQTLRDSNIKIAAAAPLFRPEQESAEDFIKRRDEKLERIAEAAQPMRVVRGAVLPFSYCIAHPRELEPFTLGSSSYLLIEPPTEPISEAICEEISRLRIVSGFCPIAADIDKLFGAWSPEEWLSLQRSGMLLQMSVTGLLEQEYRKLALYLLANGYVHFVATGSREDGVPRFIEAMRVIQRSLPAKLYRRIKNNPGMLLSDAEPSSFFSE